MNQWTNQPIDQSINTSLCSVGLKQNTGSEYSFLISFKKQSPRGKETAIRLGWHFSPTGRQLRQNAMTSRRKEVKWSNHIEPVIRLNIEPRPKGHDTLDRNWRLFPASVSWPKTETKKRNDRESARFITLHACLPSQFLQNSNLHAFLWIC